MTDALYQAIISYHRAPTPIKRRHVGELVEQGHLEPEEAETLTRASAEARGVAYALAVGMEGVMVLVLYVFAALLAVASIPLPNGLPLLLAAGAVFLLAAIAEETER